MLVTASDAPCIIGCPADVLVGDDPEFELVGSLTFRQRLDSRGRIIIPQKLREYAGITNVVVFVSIDDGYFELWGQVNWEIEEIYASKMSLYLDDQ